MVRADKLLDVEIRSFRRIIKSFYEDQDPKEYKEFLAWKEKMTEERRKAAVRA